MNPHEKNIKFQILSWALNTFLLSLHILVMKYIRYRYLHRTI